MHPNQTTGELENWRNASDARASWFDRRAAAAREDAEEERRDLEAYETGEDAKKSRMLGEFSYASGAERKREELEGEVRMMIKRLKSVRH